MEKVVEERLGEWKRALREARVFAECAAERLAPAAVILYGSFARGDFNEWSDIDVLVVTGRRLPRNPLRRLEPIDECLRLSPRVEPLVLTLEELERSLEKRNPAVVEAVERGILLADTGAAQRLPVRGARGPRLRY